MQLAVICNNSVTRSPRQRAAYSVHDSCPCNDGCCGTGMVLKKKLLFMSASPRLARPPASRNLPEYSYIGVRANFGPVWKSHAQGCIGS